LEKLSLRYPASPCSSIPVTGSMSLSRHLLLARLHPTKNAQPTDLWLERTFQRKARANVWKRNLPGQAKHAALCFNGGPAWFPRPPPPATRWHQFKPCRHQFKPRRHHHGAGCAATPMPLVASTLPWARRPGLIQQGLTEEEGKGRRRTDRRAPKSTEGAVVRQGMWRSSAPRTNVNHSQLLQHEAGLGDVAVPTIFYALAINRVRCEAAIMSDVREYAEKKEKKPHHAYTPQTKIVFPCKTNVQQGCNI